MCEETTPNCVCVVGGEPHERIEGNSTQNSHKTRNSTCFQQKGEPHIRRPPTRVLRRALPKSWEKINPTLNAAVVLLTKLKNKAQQEQTISVLEQSSKIFIGIQKYPALNEVHSVWHLKVCQEAKHNLINQSFGMMTYS